jgi:signal transduction histidine kinase
MTKTVNTLLHFARIEAGKYKPKYEEYKLNKQILSLIHEIMEETTEENKQFSTYLSNDTAVVSGDPYLLTVSVENILQNALRHGEEGEIEVKTFLENGRAGITVENRGRIENLEEVFHTYKTTHEYRGGTGLGMSIVKRFIEVQNGSIDVENISDSGENLVRVTLTLPLPSGT